MKRIILFLLLVFLVAGNAFAVTNFTVTVKTSGGDATTLGAAEAIIDEDLTAATIKVYAGAISAGTQAEIIDGEAITANAGASTGTCVHVTATQILVKTVAGDAIETGDIWDDADGNTFTVTDAGAAPRVTISIEDPIQDTTKVVFNGGTYDVDNFLLVKCVGAARHHGVWSTDHYTLQVQDDYCIDWRNPFVEIDGLQIRCHTLTAAKHCIWPGGNITAGTNIIKNCIIRGADQVTYAQYGFYLNDADGTFYFINNIMYDFGYNGVIASGGIVASNCTNVYCYNNTLFGLQTGIYRAAGTVTANNNIIQNCGDGFSGTITADYNISNVAGDGVGANGYAGVDVVFENETDGSEDLHLNTTDTVAKGVGNEYYTQTFYSFDTSSENEYFLWDIDGMKRSSVWSIGADELHTATTYYVDATTGSDADTGLSEELAWQTIAKINDFAENPGFASGDTIQLKRGETWTADECLGNDDTTAGSVGSLQANCVNFGSLTGLTIQSYGTGAKPRLDGNTQRPIYINSDYTLSGLTVKDIDISGEDWLTTKHMNVFITYCDDVTVDGVDGDGHVAGTVNYYGKTAVELYYCTGASEIKNCTLNNWGPETILTLGTDYMGIVVYGQTSGTVSIHDNTVYDCTADCLHYYATTVTGLVYNNTFYNGGEQAIDVKSSTNLTLYENTIYREAAFTGTGGGGTSSMFVIHDPDGLVTGSSASWNVVVRNNYFEGGNKACLAIQGHVNNDYATGVHVYENDFNKGVLPTSDWGIIIDDECAWVKIYRNTFTGMTGNIKLKNPVSYVDIYDNLFLNWITLADALGDIGGIYSNGVGTNISITNNTFYSTTGTGETAILIEGAKDASWVIRNNAVYISKALATECMVKLHDAAAAETIDHNLYYNPLDATKVLQSGATVYGTGGGATAFSTWVAIPHAGELNVDPVLNANYSLGILSPCIDAGIIVPQSGAVLGYAPDIGCQITVGGVLGTEPYGGLQYGVW